MITFNPSIKDDLVRIDRWGDLDIDPTHESIPSSWWITGSDCVVAFRLDDSDGPVLYVRMDDEAPLARLNTQFGPESEVSKKRVILGLLEGFPVLAELMKQKGFKGIVFESVSRSLIDFMAKLGFIPMGGSENIDDHVMYFEEKDVSNS